MSFLTLHPLPPRYLLRMSVSSCSGFRYIFIFLFSIAFWRVGSAAAEDSPAYPRLELLRPSPGNTTYHVDPTRGDDANAGTDAKLAWKSFAGVNALNLAAGDRVVIAPGEHRLSLRLSGTGTADKPVVVQFLPGRHRIAADGALRRSWFISNACDDPTLPRPVGILVEKARHFRIEGTDSWASARAEILLAGRIIQFVNEHSVDIHWQGLVFDLERPTVSEFRVLESGPAHAIVRAAEGSAYRVDNGVFSWTGDLGPGKTLVQEAIPAEGKCWRLGMRADFPSASRAEDLGDGRIRFEFAEAGQHPLRQGHQFQFRNTTRDTVGAHNNRCRNLVFRDCVFHALTGMGIVSQFTENIAFERVLVVPPEDSLRTCPAWADALHFSGCRGTIRVEDCRFSGLQDDAINVHGTYLRVTGQPAPDQLLVAFMHRQTYGFTPFQPGDMVAVVSHEKLREYPGNPPCRVNSISRAPGDDSGKQWLLTLDAAAPRFSENDAVENLTWCPDVQIRRCHVSNASCRGFLLSTRGKVVVEDCVFDHTAMAGILIAGDAGSWFESGQVRDMLIKGNHFASGGIEIKPETDHPDPAEPVHENIRIVGNFFNERGVSAKNTAGLVIRENRFRGASVDIRVEPSCEKPVIVGNQSGSER
ncbi:MAG: right-handed parallel beta-helix repeat-containing protein [Verrucomicrobiales bacterium]